MPGIYSSLLREKREEVIALWQQRSLEEIPAAGIIASLVLRDSLPEYLDHLSDALATNRKLDIKSVLAHDKESIRVGRMHGSDRASNTSYVLTEVIFEYHILREVIFEVLETDGPLAKVQRDIILDSIEQAVNDAAVKFSEVHADIQQLFINTLTHDLKNPLTAANVSAQVILRRPADTGVCTASANRILNSLNRLEGMINNLLDVNRIRAGEPLALRFTHCDLKETIHTSVDEMSVIYGDRFLLDAKESVEGYWSPEGLRRAIENLVENAVKYSTPGTPIAISLRRMQDAFELSVHNQGTPIPENEIPLLFEQYRRSKSAEDDHKPGWGLGLALVKGVVDAHNGNVRAESAPGTGTRFVLEVPFEREAPAKSSATSH